MKKRPIKILWFSWKDLKNPTAGGAEIVDEEIAKRLVKEGYEVIFVVAGFEGGKSVEKINGYQIIRLGNKWTVHWLAYRYYKKNLVGWADLVIDGYFAIPFFCKFYAKERNILFIHQICESIWFYQMWFPLNILGYLAEKLVLLTLKHSNVIVVSKSVKSDLKRYGFEEDKIAIITLGIRIKPVENLAEIKKYREPTVLSFGSIRPMKRPDHILKAFGIAKREIPDLKFVIAGGPSGAYGRRFLEEIKKSKYQNSISYYGQVSEAKKIELMHKAHIFCMTSVHEGWGLTVTEAASQGTPTIAYNVNGLRNSVQDKKTGILCRKNNPKELAKEIVKLFNNQPLYNTLQKSGWEFSKQINFSRSVENFTEIIDGLINNK